LKVFKHGFASLEFDNITGKKAQNLACIHVENFEGDTCDVLLCLSNMQIHAIARVVNRIKMKNMCNASQSFVLYLEIVILCF